MGTVNERFDVFPFESPARELLRDEAALLSPAVPPPVGIKWDTIPPLKVAFFEQEYQDKVFAPPRVLWEGNEGRIEWQQMNFRQPMYHRNLDVDELSYQIHGERTLMTEIGTVELRPGDMVRIPVGVAHDNYGRRQTHILWYFPTAITDVSQVTKRGEVLIPPFEGWIPEIVNEVHTDCLGGFHCDRAVQRSDEMLILQQANVETDRLAVMKPVPQTDSTEWTWKGPDHWVGITSLGRNDGRTYTRHRNADEVQYQIEGTRLLISANGVVEMKPGTFVHIPVGVAFASITTGDTKHVTTISRFKLESVYEGATESTRWTADEIEDYRSKVLESVSS
jgi:uncharacterized cupin superfamily protein